MASITPPLSVLLPRHGRQTILASEDAPATLAQSQLFDALRIHSPFAGAQQRIGPSLHVPIIETAGAAGIESFYRSAMNTLINRRITGIKGTLFPNMHIQVPTRMMYITGFKTIRFLVDNSSGIRPETYGMLELPVRLGMAVTPGVIMTPVSSILEACNATANPEPINRKWVRGIVPRCGREVIFGVGLNQMSDHFRDKAPEHLPLVLRSAIGSLAAGVISGYLSQVPHSLSTLKLMNPSKTYSQLFAVLKQGWEKQLSSSVLRSSPDARSALVSVLTVVAPRGVLVRSTQIVGSFILLNGLITFFTSLRS